MQRRKRGHGCISSFGLKGGTNLRGWWQQHFCCHGCRKRLPKCKNAGQRRWTTRRGHPRNLSSKISSEEEYLRPLLLPLMGWIWRVACCEDREGEGGEEEDERWRGRSRREKRPSIRSRERESRAENTYIVVVAYKSKLPEIPFPGTFCYSPMCHSSCDLCNVLVLASITYRVTRSH